MSKVDDLVTASGQLTDEEIKKLRVEIERLEKARRRFHIELTGFNVALTRLDDEDYIKLGRRSLAIEDGWHPGLLFAQSATETHRRLNLAEVYFTLCRLYGESGRYYDHYKGTFSFPFALEVIKGSRTYDYLLNIRDFRGTCEFLVRKVVDSKNVDDRIYPPFADEFSREEIDYFIRYFQGYLMGRLEAFMSGGEAVTPFLHRVQSNAIFYGYHTGRFFETDYGNQEQLDHAYDRLAAELGITQEGQNEAC